MSSLRLNNDIHKILISSPARFVGSYISEDISINLSFPTQDRITADYSENPYQRTFMVIAFKYEHDGGMILRDLSTYGDYFCALLSILYGKDFQYHGLLESHGIHRLPNIESGVNSLYEYPQYNFKPRVDLEIPLNLENFGLIEPLLLDTCVATEDFRLMIIAASKFYNRALNVFPKEKELAFLDLITCGEIISNFNDEEYTDEQLYDENLLRNFIKILEVEKGDRIVKDLKNRLFQVKRKFVFSLHQLLNDSFYEVTEVTNASVGNISKENIESLLKAAYDLRSQYVHLGSEFGDFIKPHKGFFNEVIIGEPRGLEEKVNKILSKSPTFLGLERILRYSMLRLIHKNGISIHESLD